MAYFEVLGSSPAAVKFFLGFKFNNFCCIFLFGILITTSFANTYLNVQPGNVHSFLPTLRPSASIMHFSAAFELDKGSRELYPCM